MASHLPPFRHDSVGREHFRPCEMTIAGIRNVSFTKKRYIPPLQLHKRRELPRRVRIDPQFGCILQIERLGKKEINISSGKEGGKKRKSSTDEKSLREDSLHRC